MSCTKGATAQLIAQHTRQTSTVMVPGLTNHGAQRHRTCIHHLTIRAKSPKRWRRGLLHIKYIPEHSTDRPIEVCLLTMGRRHREQSTVLKILPMPQPDTRACPDGSAMGHRQRPPVMRQWKLRLWRVFDRGPVRDVDLTCLDGGALRKRTCDDISLGRQRLNCERRRREGTVTRDTGEGGNE